MSANESMADKRLAEARAALDGDMLQWHREYNADLIAEVKRLRALTTVNEDMVERGAMVMCTRTTHPGARRGWGWATPAAKDAWREDARAVLDAALGTGEGS